MAGFGKITVVGNAGGQNIVNVFWYRSEQWFPLLGDPFTTMQEVIDHWILVNLNTWLFCHPGAYVLQRVEGVGYNNAMVEQDGSTAVRTVQEVGTGNGGEFDSYALTANITWICGPQHQISGVGSSQRNRGTTAIGPVASEKISDSGHFVGNYISQDVDAAANTLRSQLVDFQAISNLTPVRLHTAVALGIKTGTTWSDILGYKLPTKVSVRRSRLPEA